MPDCCSVFGCTNRSNRDKDKRFFRIPKAISHKGGRHNQISKKRREKWIENISTITKKIDSPHARVCSDHFVKGRPSSLYDVDDVDWAPTLKLGNQRVKLKRNLDFKRLENLKLFESKRRSLESIIHKLKSRHIYTATLSGSLELYKQQNEEKSTSTYTCKEDTMQCGTMYVLTHSASVLK